MSRSLLKYFPGKKCLPGTDMLKLSRFYGRKEDMHKTGNLLDPASTRSEKDAWSLIAQNILGKGKGSLGGLGTI